MNKTATIDEQASVHFKSDQNGSSQANCKEAVTSAAYTECNIPNCNCKFSSSSSLNSYATEHAQSYYYNYNGDPNAAYFNAAMSTMPNYYEAMNREAAKAEFYQQTGKKMMKCF
jgi:hypothetical protein